MNLQLLACQLLFASNSMKQPLNQQLVYRANLLHNTQLCPLQHICYPAQQSLGSRTQLYSCQSWFFLGAGLQLRLLNRSVGSLHALGQKDSRAAVDSPLLVDLFT
jgi:hypothetical protein